MFSIEPAAISSAFLLGLLGSAHCLGMCGGLASALGMSTSHGGKTSYIFFYNAGRLLSYTIAGAIVGSFGFWLSQHLGAAVFLRYFAALILILLGLYLGQWFNGLIVVERLGQKLWRVIQPLAKHLMPIRSARDALFVGMVWGWLPCGLVYSALIYASAQGSTAGTALVMVFFGLGTLPAMLATGLFAKRLAVLVGNRWFRSGTGCAMIIYGIWSLPLIQSAVYQLLAIVQHSSAALA